MKNHLLRALLHVFISDIIIYPTKIFTFSCSYIYSSYFFNLIYLFYFKYNTLIIIIVDDLFNKLINILLYILTSKINNLNLWDNSILIDLYSMISWIFLNFMFYTQLNNILPFISLKPQIINPNILFRFISTKITSWSDSIFFETYEFYLDNLKSKSMIPIIFIYLLWYILYIQLRYKIIKIINISLNIYF